MLNTGETSTNKLIILFVFDKMESALSERTIVDMCSTSNSWMGYMDCVNVIHKLKDDNFICVVNEDDDTLYTITQRNACELLHKYPQKREGRNFAVRQKEQRKIP